MSIMEADLPAAQAMQAQNLAGIYQAVHGVLSNIQRLQAAGGGGAGCCAPAVLEVAATSAHAPSMTNGLIMSDNLPI